MKKKENQAEKGAEGTVKGKKPRSTVGVTKKS